MNDHQSTPMSKAAAWIMKIDQTLYVSVSQLELVHIINEPDYIEVPGAHDYCKNIIIWNDNILPVVNISHLTGNHDTTVKHNVVAVIIYRGNDEQVQFGGVSQISSPELEYVDNNQACTLPDLACELKEASLSCFTCEKGRKIPIIDLSKLFSRNYSQYICSDQTSK